jgi:hypothetical protein
MANDQMGIARQGGFVKSNFPSRMGVFAAIWLALWVGAWLSELIIFPESDGFGGAAGVVGGLVE